jgi:alpha-amylase/alpha-mannosidase (GH57 family)
MNNRYIVIHGHFYQPPRENAWLDQIEIQESAAPYHDWNERVSHECYGPNGVSRILNEKGKIVDIVNNYARMSFNVGPTLFSWMEQKETAVYNYILEADKLSLELFNGHGSAIAQVYNHIIMPLATRADKETQVKWGIQDFEQRFARKPEGMWLAETAVDTETLEVLAENDIRFTILAPYQAKQFRKLGDAEWTSGIDTRRPYMCNLPSGKQIALFFYDGPRSQGVAFNGYLNNGRFFADSLLSGLDENPAEPQLLHIATDGETYGHHHKNGDMALAYCARYIEENKLATITNYSQYLALFPPQYEVQINEATSWSCAHGVERWRSNCGCETGGQPGWNQEWRVGLRNAINWLRDAFDAIYDQEIRAYHPNPAELRNTYITLILNRSADNIAQFFKKNFKKTFSPEDVTHIIRLLEMQKQSLYMQTSCGWFFNDISGIETIQILQYANRGIQLAQDESSIELEDKFLELLATAKSNLAEHGTGADIYKKWVATKRLSLTQVGMHYAVSSLFEEENREITVLNYDCQSEKFSRKKGGQYILTTGATRVRSRVTLSTKQFHYAILYLGNHHLIGSTATKLSEAEFDSIVVQIEKSFDEGNIAECIDIIKWNFLDRSFSFYNLFKDEQLKLLKLVIGSYEDQALTAYDRIYESSYTLMNLMRGRQLAIPPMLQRNMENVFQFKIEEMLDVTKGYAVLGRLKRYAVEVRRWNVQLDTERLAYFASSFISHHVGQFPKRNNQVEWAQKAYEFLEILYAIDVHPSINKLQDFVFRLAKENHLKPELKQAIGKLAHLINLELPQQTENLRAAETQK